MAQVSDDFSAPVLDTGLWTTVDPVGDSTFNQSNGRLRVELISR